MRIRPVTAADFDAIAALTNIFIRDTVIHFGEEPVTAEELRTAWQSTRDLYPFLVAEDDGDQGPAPSIEAWPAAFLGYAKAGAWRTRSAYRFSAEVGIYMVPAAQGRGLGTALYSSLIDACRKAGFHALIGGITMPNEASVRLHERLGFAPIGVFPEVGFKFDRWHDVGFWQRKLG